MDGDIQYFAIRKDGSNYAFLRIGYDAEGNARTESYQTTTQNGQMGLNSLNDLVWYVVCRGSCDFHFCTPSSDGEYCECLGDNGDEDNTVDDIDIYEDTGIVTDLDDVIGDGGLEGNCDFGGAGGGSYGIYATRVLN